MKRHRLLHQHFHVVVDASSFLGHVPLDRLDSAIFVSRRRKNGWEAGKGKPDGEAGQGETNLERPDVGREPVAHDGDELRVDLILVLLVVLQFDNKSGAQIVRFAVRLLTRFSLSNSTSITACFALRWRRKVSRT